MFHTHQYYPGNSEICVEVTTGTGFDNGGFLKVVMDGIVTANYDYDKGEVVMNICFFDLQNIIISNPSSDAWVGSISITDDGRATKIDCIGCSGDSYSGSIVVDGDTTSLLADTKCLDGKDCTITWEVLGTINRYLYYHVNVNYIVFHRYGIVTYNNVIFISDKRRKKRNDGKYTL